MDFPTRNNRLLEYKFYEPDGQGGERLLRTVSYTYFRGGHVSNIGVKDEYHAGVTPGQPEDYEWVYDLALYYDTRSAPRLALWDRWKLDGQGDPDPQTCERLWAREFRYEWLFGTMRARYLAVDYDPSGSDNPADWPLIEPVALSDSIGVAPYADAEVRTDGQGTWLPPTETVSNFFTAGQHTFGTAETRYFHGDLIDSTVMATGETGAPAATLAYTAFGEPIGDPDALGTRYRYAGGWGYESGLADLQGANTDLPPLSFQHVGFRWYDPSLGRFLQRDPIGLAAGLNVYEYVHSAPATAVDATGLIGLVTRYVHLVPRWYRDWLDRLLPRPPGPPPRIWQPGRAESLGEAESELTAMAGVGAGASWLGGPLTGVPGTLTAACTLLYYHIYKWYIGAWD
jgi:RHS repeat-associated protein